MIFTKFYLMFYVFEYYNKMSKEVFSGFHLYDASIVLLLLTFFLYISPSYFVARSKKKDIIQCYIDIIPYDFRGAVVLK